MKTLIIGGVAGGASTAARLRRLDEEAEIIIFERGADISFANCGIPYYCGEVIKDKEKLLVMTPQKLKDLLNIEARVKSEVLSINKDEKFITVKDLTTGQEYKEAYDKLVLSPGAYPVKPNIEGINDSRIFAVRNLDDADKIKKYVEENSPKSAAIVGAGFIGLEMAENLAELGINTSIIEMSNQILPPVDYEIAATLHNHLRENGVKLYLNDGVKAFNSENGLNIILSSGMKIDVDFVILAIGVRPEAKLASEAGLKIGKSGGIWVNENLQTSDSNIYALGDAIEVKDTITNLETLIPLAGPANKQGRIVAENICGINSKYTSTQGTSILKLFDYTTATTGASEKTLKRNNIAYEKVYVHGMSHADYYPEAFPLMIKLLFTPVEGKILGAQVIGLDGIDKRIDIIATAIKFEKTVKDLKELELSYAPPFGSAKDPVNIAGMVAENLLERRVNMVYYDQINELSDDYLLIDVRNEAERTIGKIEGSINIPLEKLRSRLSEIPKDKKIILYCSKGLKSYFASRILMQKGYDVSSLSGGYLLYKQVKFEKSNPNFNCKFPQAKTQTHSVIKLDACGMQCPGPIMKLSETFKTIEEGDIVEISTTDPGFKMDVEAWCNSTQNELLNISTENKITKAQIKKGVAQQISNKVSSNAQTLIVFSNDLDKVMASFIIANGAAAAGKDVTMFFTFWGINALRKSNSPKVKKNLIEKMFGIMMPKGVGKLTLSKMNMLGMGSEMMKAVMKSKNVPSLPELIEMAKANGIRIIACNMAMDVMGIKKEELIENVEIGGVAAYIDASSNANSNLFI